MLRNQEVSSEKVDSIHRKRSVGMFGHGVWFGRGQFIRNSGKFTCNHHFYTHASPEQPGTSRPRGSDNPGAPATRRHTNGGCTRDPADQRRHG